MIGYFSIGIGIVILFGCFTMILNNTVFNPSKTGRSIVVVIDAGHGGIDPGASSKNGVAEDEINLSIALKLRHFIEQAGGIAIMTREDNNGLYTQGQSRIRSKKNEDLNKRSEIINSSNANIYISIHLNYFSQSKYYGAQTFYKRGDENGKLLAELIQEELRNILGRDNNRVAKFVDGVYIMNNSKIPGALVECGFLSNPEEERLLQDDEYQNKVAFSIFCGIMRYLN